MVVRADGPHTLTEVAMFLATLHVLASSLTTTATNSIVGEQAPPAVEAPFAHAPHLARDFTPIPGVRALGSRLIVRPLQPAAFVRAGLALEDAWVRRTAARQAIRRHDVVRYVPETDEYVVHLREAGSEERVAAELLATGNFEYAEADWLLSPSVVAPAAQGAQHTGPRVAASGQVRPDCPDDLFFANEWHHQAAQLDSCLAWNITTGIPGVSIGVCDTGLRSTHEDLQLHRREGYNAVDRLWESQGGETGPVYNHGTRTTGTAAANGNNGVGVAGVGWDLGFRMLRVSNLSDGGAWLSDLQHAARTSIENGDRVANVSYAGVVSLSNLPTATYIKSLGGLLVWAAGNEGAHLNYSDRDADDLIVVGATDAGSALAYFSNSGTFVDFTAPGVNIETTDSYGDNGYTSSASGTSFAAPIASGVAAMIWSARPGLSPNDVELLLKAGAHDLGAAGLDDVYGYGGLDLLASLSIDGSATPQAQLAGVPASGVSPLVVRFRDLSPGVPTAWAWDFGDGATSTQQNPVHTYTTLGIYNVTLAVTNVHGTDATTSVGYVLVDVIPPIAEFDASVTGGLSPLPVAFSDRSTGGTPTAWSWSFGDGSTSTLRDPAHVYATAGSYTVSLTVSNAYGSDTISKPAFVSVDWIPPVAGFSGVPTTGNSPYVVHFTDESTGGVATSWQWYFGDGGASTLRNPAHTYTVPGTYSVRLTASNAYGADDLDRIGYVVVGPGPTIRSDFVGTPTNGTAPFAVHFTDLSVGNVTGWEWDFGDGGTSTLQNPTHVYTVPGEYDVSLQVTNALGFDDQLDRNQYIVVD